MCTSDMKHSISDKQSLSKKIHDRRDLISYWIKLVLFPECLSPCDIFVSASGFDPGVELTEGT